VAAAVYAVFSRFSKSSLHGRLIHLSYIAFWGSASTILRPGKFPLPYVNWTVRCEYQTDLWASREASG